MFGVKKCSECWLASRKKKIRCLAGKLIATEMSKWSKATWQTRELDELATGKTERGRRNTLSVLLATATTDDIRDQCGQQSGAKNDSDQCRRVIGLFISSKVAKQWHTIA